MGFLFLAKSTPSFLNRRMPARVLAAAWLAAAALVMASCQSYQAEPLDREKHRQEWEARQPSPFRAGDDGYTGEPDARATKKSLGVPLTLAQAERTALLFNPGLRQARAEAGVSAATAAYAGRLADPTLELGIASLLKGGASPWTLGLGVGFSIPLSGRLGAEKDLAREGVTLALAQAAELEYQVTVELRREWVAAEYLWIVIDTLGEVAILMDNAKSRTTAAREAGRMSTSEAAVFDLELALISSEIRSLEAEFTLATQRIRTLMGLPVSYQFSPVVRQRATEITRTAPNLVPATHPTLLVHQARYAQAEAALRLAIEKQYPDLSLTPGVEWDQGEPKGGIGLSIPIPVIDGNRREIAEARAARIAAKTAYESTAEEIQGRARLLWLEAQFSQARAERIANDVLPLFAQQIIRLDEMAALGRAEPLTLLDALRGIRDHRLERIAALREAEVAGGELAALMDAGRSHDLKDTNAGTPNREGSNAGGQE